MADYNDIPEELLTALEDASVEISLLADLVALVAGSLCQHSGICPSAGDGTH